MLRTDSVRVAPRVRAVLLERIARTADAGQPAPQQLSVDYELIERQSIGPCPR